MHLRSKGPVPTSTPTPVDSEADEDEEYEGRGEEPIYDVVIRVLQWR